MALSLMTSLPSSDTLVFYRRDGCGMCDEARLTLQQVLEDRAKAGERTPRVRYLDIDGAPELSKGERVIVRLPQIGRIEAYCIWTTDDRAGFQFERIIRLDDFMAMIGEIQPNPRLRRRS